MDIFKKQLNRSLQFEWMNLVGPSCDCSSIIHSQLTCLQQLLLKFTMTMKTVSKFYILFHLLPYLLKVKKMIREKRFISSTMKAILNFIGSLLFMAHLVCGLKATLCTYSNLNLKIQGSTFLWGGFPTGISILWQSKTRRQQIAYYAFVRSIRGAFMFLKRKGIVKFDISSQILIVLFCGCLSYFYLQKQDSLKYLNIFQGLWGKI